MPGMIVPTLRPVNGFTLAHLFSLCSHAGAMRIDDPHALNAIATALLSAPGWARVGITAPKEFLREEAAKELARVILQSTEEAPEASPDQLRLSL